MFVLSCPVHRKLLKRTQFSAKELVSICINNIDALRSIYVLGSRDIKEMNPWRRQEANCVEMALVPYRTAPGASEVPWSSPKSLEAVRDTSWCWRQSIRLYNSPLDTMANSGSLSICSVEFAGLGSHHSQDTSHFQADSTLGPVSKTLEWKIF